MFKLRATGSLQEIDAAEIVRAASHLFDPSFNVQISGMPFCNGNLRTLSAANPDAIVSAIREVAGGAGTYYSLNPLPAGLTSHATADKPVRRRWLLVDADPTQHKVNATEEEHDAARDLACQVFDGLESDGWPQPISLDSGNGWHLLYRIDLPNDEESRQLCHDILAVLGSRYNTADASIDTATATAKQIAKMPGTWARKSPHTKERPQRMCKLHYVPAVIETVPVEVMKALAAVIEKKKPIRAALPIPPVERGPIWRCKATEGNAGREYGKRALQGETQRVRMCVKNRNITLNDAAFRMGTLIPTGWITEQEVESEMTVAATLNGLMDDENDGHRKTIDCIKRAIRDGIGKPRTVILNGEHKQETEQKTNPDKPAEKKESGGVEWDLIIDGEVTQEGDPATWLHDSTSHWSASSGKQVFEIINANELMAREFPAPKWIVPGVLSEGLNLLIGKPKLGKSILSQNLAITIAAGGKALGNVQTVQGDVLYLALEDTGLRLKNRMGKMLKGLNVQSSRRLHYATRWPRQHQGGMDMIHHWCTQVAENPVLVIIDVLKEFRESASSKTPLYDQDYSTMKALKNLLDHNRCNGLVVHHARKSETDDPEDDTSGTNGLNGASDGILTLRRSKGVNNEATVHVTGRDVPRQEIAVRFDLDTLTWVNLGKAAEVLSGELQRKVLDYMQQMPGKAIWPNEIAIYLKEDVDKVRVTLFRMMGKGIIQRMGKAWAYPGPGESSGGGSEEF